MNGIANRELLTDVFGGWPSFHDAEVLRLRLDRAEPSAGPTLEADIYVFATTPEITPDGHYRLDHQSVVTLRFEGVDKLDLGDFNYQNVLAFLDIEDIRVRQLELLEWHVSFGGSFGVSAEFFCHRVGVVRIGPYPEARERLPSN